MQSFHRTTWAPKEMSEQQLQIIIPFAAELEVMPSRGTESCRGRVQEEHQVSECLRWNCSLSDCRAPSLTAATREQSQREHWVILILSPQKKGFLLPSTKASELHLPLLLSSLIPLPWVFLPQHQRWVSPGLAGKHTSLCTPAGEVPSHFIRVKRKTAALHT